MYSSSDNWQFEFYLCSSNPNINSDSTTNLEYGLSWLLNLLHMNISDRSHIEIRKKTCDSNTQYIKEGTIFWEDGFIVKKLNLDDDIKTVYSPYDLSLFDKTHLSLSYSKLIQYYKNTIQTKITTPQPLTQQPLTQQPLTQQPLTQQPLTQQPLTQQPLTQQPLTPTQQLPTPTQQPLTPTQQPLIQQPQTQTSNFKQINKLLDETNFILKSSNMHQIEDENEVNSDSDVESVSSEQLRELEENLDRMMNEQKELKNTLEDEKDKLADIIMEENYQKTLRAKEENKKKEKRNIFVSDLSVYKKLNKQNSQVPDFFMAKCVVFDFLDKNKYLETEDLELPSEELFQLYTILYNSRFVDNYEPPEDFEEVVLDFLDSLPDVELMTERDYHNKLNKLSEFGMFSTDIVRT